jgi:hypothetical protein
VNEDLVNERGGVAGASGVMTSRASRRRILGFGAGALAASMVGLTPGIASASEGGPFAVMIANPWSTRKARAQLEVAVSTDAGVGAPTTVDVHAPDGSQHTFSLLSDEQGFASTAELGDLFEVSHGQSALVLAHPPSGIANAVALRQTLDGAGVTLGVPPMRLPAATPIPLAADVSHYLAVGDLARRTTLLVANVAVGQPADVGIFVGDVRHPPRFSNPEVGVYQVWEVPLTPAEAHSFLIVASSVEIIVQLAVDDGKRVQVTGPIV